ncbi:DUF6418 domain-containing protein [Enterobacter cloacae]|uniref:DUF6418 domain-containing protein n=1 Tax=Enterobacter cloacae TaxID=550 RepID=UPI00200630D4|nr:DUF6418 domain-containing protein [Enterobacter cloacae]MCK7221060.1 DUF6418 domain-containing protein [Enterobacter cloacae]MDK9961828.1 DUF6418 domain-containing protein [Enterobacter cloacae]MDK9964257.1 DUF6418 domain-containing protein [Enterobacter cloacae]
MNIALIAFWSIYIVAIWAGVFPYLLTNVTGVILWIFTCIVQMKRDSDFGVMSLLFYFTFTLTAIISVYADTGVWLSEVKYTSYETGSTSRVISLVAVLFISAFCSFKALSRVRFVSSGMSNLVSSLLMSAVHIIVVSMIAVLLYTRIRYGSPNEFGVDRFYYWNNIAPSWAEYCKFTLEQMSLLIGLLYAVKEKRYFLLLFLMSLLSQFLVGEKFTGLYISILLFVIPVFVYRKYDIWKMIKSPRFVALSLIFAGVLIFTALLSYVSIAGSDSAMSLLLGRVVLQAQMWWAVDNYSSGYPVSFDEIWQSFLGFGADEEQSGIRYLMGVIAPSYVYQWFLDRGITFTMGSPVNLIYFFGYPLSVIPAAVLGSVLAFSFKMLRDSIAVRDVILTFLAVKFFYTMIRVITMGDVFQLTTPKVIFYIMAFLAYSVISLSFNKDRAYV